MKTKKQNTEPGTVQSPAESPTELGATPCSPLVVVVPLDTPAECIADLRAAGMIAIRTDKPDAVRIVTPGAQIVGGDLLMSAMHGLCTTPYLAGDSSAKMRAEMVTELHRRMKSREATEVEANSMILDKTVHYPAQPTTHE